MLFDIEYKYWHYSGIYVITNLLNHKIYIGSTVDFRARYRKHRMHLINQTSHSKQLIYFINKYGIDSLEFSLIEIVPDKTELKNREQYFLDLYKPFGTNGFNSAIEAKSCLGAKQSEELKEWRRQRWIGNQIFQGRKHTDEAKRKVSLSKIGKKTPYRKMSDEELAKRALTRKPCVHTDESKKKLSEAHNKIKVAILQFDLNNIFIERHESLKIIERKFGFGRSGIRKCCNNIYKQYGGFIWKYENK